jgi:uncharacterized repeat protein (TIGR01451 family)
VPSGWEQTTATCTDGSAIGSISLQAGETVTCTFTNTQLPTIEVTKTANPTSVPETGGTVTYTVEIENTDGNNVTLTSLEDDVFGDLLDPSNPDITNNTCDDLDGDTITPGQTISCTFDASLSGGTPGTTHDNEVCAIAQDAQQNEATDCDDATVGFSDVLPTINVIKAASPTSVPETGGLVTFTVTIQNTGTVAVNLTVLNDSDFGNLLDGAKAAITKNTCDDLDGDPIAPAGQLQCTFQAQISGDPAVNHQNTACATAVDAQQNPAQDCDDETVDITDVIPTIR